MNLTYNGFAIHNLGEIAITQTREYEEGQRVKITFKVGVTLFQRSYADNYGMVQQLQNALRTQEAVLQWQNTDNSQNYLNQTASLVSHDVPEEWGTYQLGFNITFLCYEQDLITNNLPLTLSPSGGTGNPVVLGNVSKWAEGFQTERFSPFHSQRQMVKGKIMASGYLLTDATKSLATRRQALTTAKNALEAAVNNADGVMQYGAGGSVFNRTVRVEEFTADIDEMKYAVMWQFTATYTAYPDEGTFATVEWEADQKDEETGEQFLTITGSVKAATEALALGKLNGTAAVGQTPGTPGLLATVLTQYGYAVGSQQLRADTKSKQVSANADGDFFVELDFTFEYRRWRSDNQAATFLKTSDTSGKAVSFGEVKEWELHYQARRFNDMRSQRQHAGGTVNATGTWAGDAALTLAQRRTQLLSMQTAMLTEVNGADGTLVYGAFSQVVRIENLTAHINQAITGIDWSFTATYSLFPDESGYATCEFTVAQNSDVETGDATLAFNGTILAPDEALARAKLASIRTTMLTTYGFTIDQQLRPQSTVRSVFANGDSTETLAGGDFEAADGTTFIELAFAEEYRSRRANLLSWKMTSASRSDIGGGFVITTYQGEVVASGTTADAAYEAAVAKAESLGTGKETDIGGGAFQRTSVISFDTRQTQATNVIEMVRLSFSYEYQSRIAKGSAYMEVQAEWDTQAFATDTVTVSGQVVAADATTAKSLYTSQVSSVYTGMLIRAERLSYSDVRSQNPDGSFNVQQTRLDFNFSAHVPKAVGVVTYKYAISTSNDYLQLERKTAVRGSVFAIDVPTATAAANVLLASLTGLGSLVADENSIDHEYTAAAGDTFIKYDFSASYITRLTGIKNLLEMRLTESIKYSGVRWVVQPVPRNTAGAGGVSIPQDGGLQEGGRTVRGSVTSASLVAAQGWARAQGRPLLTGDKNGGKFPLPEEMENDYEFVPRLDGVISGNGANVKLYRVNFAFAEILPLYPPPS